MIFMSQHHRTRTPAVARRTQPPVWTAEKVRRLGTTTDVVTAGQILGLSRTTAYRLARLNQFPVPLLRAGVQYRVSVAGCLLHIAADVDEVTT